MSELLIVPQAWAERYAPLPDGWWETHGLGLQRVWPECAEVVDRVAREVGIDPRLEVTRMELEQKAVSREWRGEVTNQYAALGRPSDAILATLLSQGIQWLGRNNCDLWSLYYLCGVDKTDSGPRAGGWFGPERQCYGAALRFKCLYRGQPIPLGLESTLPPLPREVAMLREDARFAPGVPVTRSGDTIIPANQASADCLRYTTSLAGSRRLAQIGRAWFPEDYEVEESSARQVDGASDTAICGTSEDDPSSTSQVTEEATMTAPTIVETNLQPVRALLRRSNTTRIVVHHSESNSGNAAAFHRYHVDHNGWAMVAYHFVILVDGTIERGRPEAVRGGHTLGCNHDSIGICVVGKCDSAEPTDAQVASLTALLAWLCAKYGLAPVHVLGHRDLNATACPGKRLYARLPGIREAIRDGRAPVPTPAEKDCLRIGDSGAQVRDLQNLLTDRGYPCGPIDGDFGPKTRLAVQAFQREHDLAPDGVVGPLTRAKLVGAA